MAFTILPVLAAVICIAQMIKTNNQAYMPKLYYDKASNPNQCHPNQKAMAFIAEKIYKELGSWLEE